MQEPYLGNIEHMRNPIDYRIEKNFKLIEKDKNENFFKQAFSEYWAWTIKMKTDAVEISIF